MCVLEWDRIESNENLWKILNQKQSEINGYAIKWPTFNISRKEKIIINIIRIGHTNLTHGCLMAK